MLVLRSAGHEPVAISAMDEHVALIRAQGFQHVEVPLSADGTNPLRELSMVRRIGRVLRAEHINVAFTYTPKANIYTGLAARSMHIVHVPNVSGLGRTFISHSLLTVLVKYLYRLAFRKAQTIFFQNDEDMASFTQLGLVQPGQSERLPGSGVDLERFTPTPPAADAERPLAFLFVGRLLRDKGVVEFVDAARVLRQRGHAVSFALLGTVDAKNPSVVERGTVEAWQAEGVIRYLGITDDVRPAMAAADCVVLPSYYREGVPRSLLEAAAMGKPCITTDMPGCRDAVDDGVTGFLCLPRSVDSLVATIDKFLTLDDDARMRMGSAGRQKMERQFSEKIVLDRYLALTERCKAR
jgi:glycosyltransferase involved in cell wall biosynthesis